MCLIWFYLLFFDFFDCFSPYVRTARPLALYPIHFVGSLRFFVYHQIFTRKQMRSFFFLCLSLRRFFSKILRLLPTSYLRVFWFTLNHISRKLYDKLEWYIWWPLWMSCIFRLRTTYNWIVMRRKRWNKKSIFSAAATSEKERQKNG